MSISTLVSFAKREIVEQIPGMECADYRIPASNGSPSFLYVEDSHYYKPDIDGHQDAVFVPSDRIAASLVHMHLTSQLLYRIDQHPAFFAIPHEELTEKTLQEKFPIQVRLALEAQKKWFGALVHMADDDWQVAHRHNMISDIQRMAARELGLKREWLMTIEDEAERLAKSCPFCGSGLLNPNAPICPACGRVHNPTQLAKLEAMLINNAPTKLTSQTTK